MRLVLNPIRSTRFASTALMPRSSGRITPGGQTPVAAAKSCRPSLSSSGLPSVDHPVRLTLTPRRLPRPASVSTLATKLKSTSPTPNWLLPPKSCHCRTCFSPEYLACDCPHTGAVKVLSDCNINPVATPMEESCKALMPMCPDTHEKMISMASMSHRELLGKLLYLPVATRPTFLTPSEFVSVSSRIPLRCKHRVAAEHVLRYLGGYVGLKLVNSRSTSPDKFAGDEASWVPECYEASLSRVSLDTRRRRFGLIADVRGNLNPDDVFIHQASRQGEVQACLGDVRPSWLGGRVMRQGVYGSSLITSCIYIGR